MLDGYKGHLESDAQKTCGLGIKPVRLEVSSDRHGYYVRFNEKNLTEKMQL